MQTLKATVLVEPLTIYTKDNIAKVIEPFEYVTLIDIQLRDKVSFKFKYNDVMHWCFRGELFTALHGKNSLGSYANHTPVVGSLVSLHGLSSHSGKVIRITNGDTAVVRDSDNVLISVPLTRDFLSCSTISTAVHEIDKDDNLTEDVNNTKVKLYPRTKIIKPGEFTAFRQHLDRYSTLAFDTETIGLLQKIYTLDDREDFVVCFTISTSAENGYYIYNDKSKEFKDLLKYICTKHLIMHNAAFDLGVLKAVYNLEPKSFDDTLIMYKCLDDSRLSYSLKTLIDECSLRGAQLKLADFNYLSYVDLGMYDKIEDIAAYYACYDTSNTFLLYNKTIKEITARPALYTYYKDIELASIVPVSVAININGLKVDTTQIESLDVMVRDHLITLENEMTVITQPIVDRLNAPYVLEQQAVQREYSRLAIQFLKNKNVIRTAAEEMLTEQLTLNCQYDNLPAYDKIKTLSVYHNRLSTRQTGVQRYSMTLGNKVFVEKLLYSADGFDLPLQVSQTGKASINKAAINELTKYIVENEKARPELSIAKDFFNKLSEYIKTKKLLEAFITPTLELVKENKDGKLHPNYNLFGTVSSRASCSNPNFQQLASNKQFDIRKAFVVDNPNESFIQCDSLRVTINQVNSVDILLGQYRAKSKYENR